MKRKTVYSKKEEERVEQKTEQQIFKWKKKKNHLTRKFWW